ncbi:MAG: DUF4367 domain-containing protein [Lachnospiraceae bacterium]|nr:DUF4367 domain-containing protein [Lachnospiraceae bacterium]
MKLEQLQNEFPKMPDELRNHIERLVAEQVEDMRQTDPEEGRNYWKEDTTKRTTGNTTGNTTGRTTGKTTDKITGYPKKRRKARILLIAAAVAALGTTALAAAKFHWFWNSEPVGNYGLNINIQNESTGEGAAAAKNQETAAAAATGQIPDEISLVNIQAAYLPAGMTAADAEVGYLKLNFEDKPYQGGITMSLCAMDDENSGKTLVEKKVVRSEQITIGDHEAVLVELDAGVAGRNGYTRRLYVLYPEYWYVLQMYISEEVSMEELTKIAEGISLVPTGETQKLTDAYTWSDYVEQQQGTGIEQDAEPAGITEEEMGKVYQIGEAVPLQAYAEDAEGNMIENTDITATVTDLKTADDLSPLGDLANSEYMEEAWKTVLDEDGKLLPDQVEFIKTGDGVETVDELAASEPLDTRLVYLTVDYTNSGEQPVYNLLFYGRLIMLEKEGEEYIPFERSPSEGNTDWDYSVYGDAYLRNGEMDFYDVRGGETQNGSNYIDCLNPGETATIHMGYLMHEDELDKLYLNLHGDRGGQALEYVDLRS